MNEEYPPQRIIDYINPCKIIERLERKGFIGPIYSLGGLIKGLLLPFETVFREINYHLNKLIAHSSIEPLTERQFEKLLEAQAIIIHPKPELFEKLKTRKQKMAGQDRDKLTDLCETLQVSANNIHYDADKGRWIIKGKRGSLSASDGDWTLTAEARSKRHASSIKRQLDFMRSVSDAEFKSAEMPTESALPVIRKIVGLNKRPALSNQRRKQLKNHAERIRGLTPVRNEGVSAFSA